MSPGINTDVTYDPAQIRAAGPVEQFLTVPVTVESGQNLVAGTIVGIPPTVAHKVAAYDNDGNAAATTPAADAGNTGQGTCTAIAVQDDYTLSQNWTLECTTTGGTGVGKFKLTGSVSGEVIADDGITVGTEFKWPNTSAYQVKGTITDGDPDFTEGDKFTFSTTRAEPLVATAILSENVNASAGDVISAAYKKGNFVYSKLTGIDVPAVADMNGVYDSVNDMLRIN